MKTIFQLRRGRAGRGRLWSPVIVLCFTASLVASVGHPAAAAPPALTRLQVVLDSTSDWARLTIPGTWVLASHAATVSPGAQLTLEGNRLTVRGPAGASATIDAVVSVPPDLATTLRLEKGYVGTAQVTVNRTTTATAELVAYLSNDVHTGLGPYAVTSSVPRSALVGSGFNPPRVDSRHLTLAFYYPWWTASSFKRGYWVERPSTDFRTDDEGSLAAQVQRANDHGIDGFIVSWDGAGSHPARFDLTLRAAEQRPGFLVAPYLEVDEIQRHAGQGPGPILDALLGMLQRAGSPAFLHTQLRPVVFVFDAHRIGQGDWAAVRQGLAQAGQNPFLVADDTTGQTNFEGFHFYNPNVMDQARLGVTYLASLGSTRLVADVDPSQPRRLWAATVSPGEDNRAARFWSPTQRPRRSGATYDATWRAAMGSWPDWILVTSWNEWIEDTAVAPGTQSGGHALDQTLIWTNAFRTHS